MPLLFQDRLDDAGESYYTCKQCGIDLVLSSNLISDEFRSGPSKALLFSGVLNVELGESYTKEMTSGNHVISNIFCKQCRKELGWTYIKAVDQCNKYKEGNFILVCPEVVSHPHRGGSIDTADAAAAAAATASRKRKAERNAATAAAEGQSSAAGSSSSSRSGSISVPAFPFATLTHPRASAALGASSRNGSLSSSSSRASSEGGYLSHAGSSSYSAARRRSSGSSSRSGGGNSMMDEEEEDDGDEDGSNSSSSRAGEPAALVDPTSALLQRLRALRRILGPPLGSIAVFPPSLLPTPSAASSSSSSSAEPPSQPRR